MRDSRDTFKAFMARLIKTIKENEKEKKKDLY